MLNYVEIENRIRENLNKTQTKYLTLGSLLIELNNPEYITSVDNIPKGRPCKNIYEVADFKFNLCKTTCKNLIGIRKRFGETDEVLKGDFNHFNFSQLCEMLSLSDDQLKDVHFRMTVQDIRALKKLIKKPEALGDVDYTSSENLIELKNDKQRQEFLQNFEAWGVWKKVDALNIEFYRCNFNNGGYLIVSTTKYFDKERHTFKRVLPMYCIIDPNYNPFWDAFRFLSFLMSEILTYLKTTKAKPVLLKKEEL